MPKYLNQENISENLKPTVKEYALPYDSEIVVRIKQQTMARMERYAEAQKKGGAIAKLETYLLIAESVIDEDGNRVWDDEQAKTLSQAKCELITALVKMIGHCSGGTEGEIEEMVGNLEETA